MIRAKITKRVAEGLKPGEWAWDTTLPGFGARCRESGRRYYVVKYGTGTRGLSKWITIGEHGGPWVRQGRPVTLTAELAREEAFRLLGEKAAGNDPAVTRDAHKAVSTVAALAVRYLEESVVPFKKPRTASEYRRLLSKVILPRIGRVRLDQLRAHDVAAMHHALRKTPREANHAMAVLSAMWSWGESIGLRPKDTNPVRGLPRFRESKRERFLAPSELARLAAALHEAQAAQPFAVAAIRLLLFTGCRLSEILSLKWEMVNLAGRTVRLPDSKTGAKTVMLNAPARLLLSELPKISGNPHVFPGRKTAGHFVGLNHVWARVRSAALLPGVRLHDLRHSFASVAVGAGASMPLIGGLLGHADVRTTARYAHLSDNSLQEAAERVGDHIATAMKAAGASGGRSE